MAVMDKLKAALHSDVAAVVMGVALVYAYIKWSIAFFDYLIGGSPYCRHSGITIRPES